VDGMKDIRCVLAHRRMDFVPDTYGECRDSSRLKASNLSTWLIGHFITIQSLPTFLSDEEKKTFITSIM